MSFKEWLNMVLSKDLICDRYKDRVAKAQSKKQFMDIVLEANGLEYLCKMKADGYGLPTKTIVKEFAPFINGNYEAEIKNRIGRTYTSAMFCGLDERNEIRVCNTATLFYGCSCKVIVPKNSFVQIYTDDDSSLEVECFAPSKCYVSHTAKAKVNAVGDGEFFFEEIK